MIITPSLKSHFLNLYSMALADVEFDESEIATLYKIANERGIAKSDIDHIILNPATTKYQIPQSLDEKIEYLYDYAKIIVADAIIDNSELKTFEKFCLKMEFKEENISGIINLLIEAAKEDIPTSEIIKFVTQTT